jgi:ABC-type arginine transport system ATPase subunit
MNPEVVNTVLDETQEYRDSQTYVTAAEITHDIKRSRNTKSRFIFRSSKIIRRGRRKRRTKSFYR